MNGGASPCVNLIPEATVSFDLRNRPAPIVPHGPNRPSDCGSQILLAKKPRPVSAGLMVEV